MFQRPLDKPIILLVLFCAPCIVLRTNDASVILSNLGRGTFSSADAPLCSDSRRLERIQYDF